MIFGGMKFASHHPRGWPGSMEWKFYKPEDERREEALQFSSSAKAGTLTGKTI
jgi:hypothetical protein